MAPVFVDLETGENAGEEVIVIRAVDRAEAVAVVAAAFATALAAEVDGKTVVGSRFMRYSPPLCLQQSSLPSLVAGIVPLAPQQKLPSAQ